MSDSEHIPEPSEMVYAPRPSWAPAFLALGAAALICGIYAEGFMVRGWLYCIVGAVFLLAALRAIVRGSIRDFFRLPRRQRVRGAALPTASLRSPKQG